MLLRRMLRVVHRWLSLALGVLFVLTSLTGGALVFAHPLDRWLNPELFERSGDHDIGINAVYSIAAKAKPDSEIAMLWLPHRHGVYEVVLHDESKTTLHIDPASGRILGARKASESLVGCLTELHVSLFSGSAGESVVGLSALPLLVVLLTGTMLWWPGWRRFRLGFHIRLRKGWFATVYDAHKATGIVAVPVLSLIAITGFLLTFHSFALPAVHALTFSRPLHYPTPEQTKCIPTGSGRLDPQSLLEIAEKAIPAGKASYLAFPASDDRPVQVRLRTPDSPHPTGCARVWINPYTGEILHLHDPGNFSMGNKLYAEWMFPLHIGSYGGEGSKWLHLLLSLAPAFLLITGVLIWRGRRKVRRRSEHRRS